MDEPATPRSVFQDLLDRWHGAIIQLLESEAKDTEENLTRLDHLYEDYLEQYLEAERKAKR